MRGELQGRIPQESQAEEAGGQLYAALNKKVAREAELPLFALKKKRREERDAGE